MSIKYEPSKLLRKVAPGSKIEKLVSSRLSLKRAAVSTVNVPAPLVVSLKSVKLAVPETWTV